MELNQGEVTLAKHLTHGVGSFTNSLIHTIMRADIHNTKKLRNAYPELVDAVVKYQNEEGYAEKIILSYSKKSSPNDD